MQNESDSCWFLFRAWCGVHLGSCSRLVFFLRQLPIGYSKAISGKFWALGGSTLPAHKPYPIACKFWQPIPPNFLSFKGIKRFSTRTNSNWVCSLKILDKTIQLCLEMSHSVGLVKQVPRSQSETSFFILGLLRNHFISSVTHPDRSKT